MSGISTPAARALGFLVALAAIVHAQAPAQRQCEVDENNPQALAKASFMVKRAQGSQDARFIATQLSLAVKALDNPATLTNAAGHALVLGRALTLWTMQPNVPMVTKRGSLGYTTNPEGMIDLAATIDTAFSVVEK